MTLVSSIKEKQKLKKNELKEKVEKLNLDLKKEKIQISLVCLFCLIIVAISYVLTKNILIFFCTLLLSIIVTYISFKKYDYLLEKRRGKLEIEFIEVFSYLRIYLSNKENVYRSLKEASQYTSINMKKEITIFLNKIDNDKSIMPFIEFGKSFKNKVIEEVMISLYQMIDGGFTQNYLNQFISLFDNFKNRYLEEDMMKRYKKLDLFITMSLGGSGYIMITMLLVIVTLIGGISSGF